jgi:LmbE family N-acetylglucosaminyl deacetylase
VPDLEPLPDDWTTALVVVAHPDDAEYGMAAAVTDWTAAGRTVAYVLATRGEAGIAGLPPAAAAPVREDEQRRSAAVVGVTTVAFLDHPDGRIEAGLPLRREVAAAIRRHRPELVLTLNHHDSWGPGSWNTPDHRALGRSVLDAVGDAASEWIFADLDGSPWRGVRWVGVAASPHPTHAVEVSAAGIAAGVASLACHRRYLEALDDRPVEDQARQQIGWATAANDRFGGRRAVTFELFPQ